MQSQNRKQRQCYSSKKLFLIHTHEPYSTILSVKRNILSESYVNEMPSKITKKQLRIEYRYTITDSWYFLHVFSELRNVYT